MIGGMKLFPGSALLLVGWVAASCGGRVIDNTVLAGSGGSGGITTDMTSGPSTGPGTFATSGTGMTSGGPSSSGSGASTGFGTGPTTTTAGSTGGVATSGGPITTTTGGIGGSIPVQPPPEDLKMSCANVCARWSAACGGFDGAACENDCIDTWIRYPGCTPIFSKFVGCLTQAPFKCNASGPVPAGCSAEQNAFTMCVQGGTPPDPGTQQCGGITPTGTMSCSGSAGGGSATSGATGGGSAPQCETICIDRNSAVWLSKCVGTSCTCSYNGMAYCSCTVRGDACSGTTCCPGL